MAQRYNVRGNSQFQHGLTDALAAASDTLGMEVNDCSCDFTPEFEEEGIDREGEVAAHAIHKAERWPAQIDFEGAVIAPATFAALDGFTVQVPGMSSSGYFRVTNKKFTGKVRGFQRFSVTAKFNAKIAAPS